MKKPKVTIICKGCSKSFEVYPSMSPFRVYCSRECYKNDKGIGVKRIAKIIK